MKSLVYHEKATFTNMGIEVQELYSKGIDNIFDVIITKFCKSRDPSRYKQFKEILIDRTTVKISHHSTV